MAAHTHDVILLLLLAKPIHDLHSYVQTRNAKDIARTTAQVLCRGASVFILTLCQIFDWGWPENASQQVHLRQ